MKKMTVFLGIPLLLLVLLLTIIYKKNDHIENYASIYSWQLDTVLENTEKFNNALKEYNIKTLYQNFKTDFLEGDDDTFLKDMYELGIAVYQLNGDPSWGKVGGAKRIKREIDLVAEFNSRMEYEIKGILLDIEPYASEREEKFARNDFKDYVKEIEEAYEYSKEKGIELILAIPYWFDSISKSNLEKLIQNTDGVSVMNYNIYKTTENIETEVELASKYDKKIETIYEIEYGEEDYFQSNEEILKDFKEMKQNFSYDKLQLSYHHYGSIE